MCGGAGSLCHMLSVKLHGMHAQTRMQKLGLSAGCLKTAFTSLTSTLTTLRTEMAGPRLTLRADISKKGESHFNTVYYNTVYCRN